VSQTVIKMHAVWRASRTLLLAGTVLAVHAQPVFALESRSYVVNWFTHLMNNVDGDCPGGIVSLEEEYRKALIQIVGKTPEEAAELMSHFREGGKEAAIVNDLMENRGRLNGKPTNAYLNPHTVPDPKIQPIETRYATGFDLDGKGPNTPGSFEDPVTHEKGVDNQLFRAIGCFDGFRGTPDHHPTFSAWLWHMMQVGSMPAWIVTVTGEDLGRNGDVTVTFNRALDPVTVTAGGNARSEMTFREDPDPRSRNVLRGRLEDGVITVRSGGDFHMLQSPLLFAHFRLKNAHLRLTMLASGGLDGHISGYQPWADVYFHVAQAGQAMERDETHNTIGMYYLMKQLADGDPDPVTGKNRGISATYRIETVPAYVIPAAEVEGKNVAHEPGVKPAAAGSRR
jgi:hypothetical protein